MYTHYYCITDCCYRFCSSYNISSVAHCSPCDESKVVQNFSSIDSAVFRWFKNIQIDKQTPLIYLTANEFTSSNNSWCIAVCMVLSLAVFWLPPTASEKFLVSGVTAIILSMFLLYFVQRLPTMAVNTPLIGKQLFTEFNLLCVDVTNMPRNYKIKKSLYLKCRCFSRTLWPWRV